MLSTPAEALPEGEGWQFESKWDGFRTLVWRDGDELLLQSRDERPMNRYFPELLASPYELRRIFGLGAPAVRSAAGRRRAGGRRQGA